MIAAMLRGLALVLTISLAACATPTQRSGVWWSADAAANWAQEVIILNDANGKPMTKVSRARVRELVDAETKLEAAAGVRAVLYLTQGEEPNGYSYPGNDGKNYIVVTLGMLELVGDDEAEQAALLGHELAHIALGHNAKRQERETTRSAASTAAGVVLTLARVPFGANAADVASTAIASAYNRDEEREADRVGLDYAKQAGFDPAGAVRLWEKLAAKSPSDGPLVFLSTHPASAERLEAMRRAAGEAAEATANPR